MRVSEGKIPGTTLFEMAKRGLTSLHYRALTAEVELYQKVLFNPSLMQGDFTVSSASSMHSYESKKVLSITKLVQAELLE